MVILKVVWGVVKVGLFLVEALFGAVDRGGRAATSRAASWGHVDEPPIRDRNSVYYDGPGSQPGRR